MKDFFELFVEELGEIYSAEQLSAKMLPEVLKSIKSPKLRESVELHWDDTKKQIKRLELIGSELKKDLSGIECQPMEGLWNEWEHVVKSHYTDEVLDSAIIGFMQKIKHYEIAVYGTLKTFARHLNFPKVENLLKESIREEILSDQTLTEIAEGTMFGGGINSRACQRKSA